MKKVRPGQAFKPLSASDHNAIASAADFARTIRQNIDGRGGQPRQYDPVIIRVRNDTGADRRIGDVVGVGAGLLTTFKAGDLYFAGETPTATHRCLAVLLETAYHTSTTADRPIVRAQLSGVCLAYVNFNATTDAGCSYSPTNHVFASQADGPIPVLTAPASTGEQLVPVLLGRLDEDLVVKTPAAGIAARSTTTVNSALCDIYRETGTGTTRTLTAVTSEQVRVFNFSNVAISGLRYVVTSVTRWGTRYVVLESCNSDT
jgi:hypothetical protein